LEYPSSSILARLYSLISLGIVLLYLLLTVLDSLPSIQLVDELGEVYSNPIISILKIPCVGFCILEMVVRFAASPRKLEFLKGPTNILDILAILPNVSIILANVACPWHPTGVFGTFCKIFSFVSFFWFIWIFKIVRYSSTLCLFFTLLGHCIKEILLFIHVIFIGMFFFGSLAFWFEKDSQYGGFESLPHCFWWVVITMTTVGYGDIFPITNGGRLVAVFCAVFGILSLLIVGTIMAFKIFNLYNRMTRKLQ